MMVLHSHLNKQWANQRNLIRARIRIRAARRLLGGLLSRLLLFLGTRVGIGIAVGVGAARRLLRGLLLLLGAGIRIAIRAALLLLGSLLQRLLWLLVTLRVTIGITIGIAVRAARLLLQRLLHTFLLLHARRQVVRVDVVQIVLVADLRVRLRLHVVVQLLDVQLLLLLLQLQLPRILELLVLVAHELLLRLVVHELQNLAVHVRTVLRQVVHELIAILDRKLLLQLVPVCDVQQVAQIQNRRKLRRNLLRDLVALQNLLLPITTHRQSHVSLLYLLHHRREHLDHGKRVVTSHAVVDIVQRLLLLLSHNVGFNFQSLLLHAFLQPLNILRRSNQPYDDYLFQVVRKGFQILLALLFLKGRRSELKNRSSSHLLDTSRLSN